LFAEPRKPYPFIKIEGPLPDEAYKDESVLLLQIPLDEPDCEIYPRVKMFIDRAKEQYLEGLAEAAGVDIFSENYEPESRRGIRAARSSKARYPVVGQPNTAALELTLAVYDCRKANPNMSSWEIWLELNPSYRRMIDIEQLSEKEIANIPGHKASWSAGVSRYVKKATAMIKNAGLGRFPDLS